MRACVPLLEQGTAPHVFSRGCTYGRAEMGTRKSMIHKCATVTYGILKQVCVGC